MENEPDVTSPTIAGAKFEAKEWWLHQIGVSTADEAGLLTYHYISGVFLVHLRSNGAYTAQSLYVRGHTCRWPG